MITTRHRHVVYLALFLITLVNYVDRVNLSIAASSIAREFQLSPVQMGFVFSAYLWTYTVCLLPFGLLVDRYGPYVITGVSLAVWSLAGAASGLVGSLGTLVVTRLLLGIGESSSYPANSRVVRDWAPPQERGLGNAIFNAGAYAGVAVGAVLVGWLVTRYGWRESFWVTGGVGFVLSLAWLRFVKRPVGAGVAAVTRPGTPVGPRLLALLRSPSMWGLAVAQFCAGYGLYFLLSWMPKYLETSRGIDLLRTGFFTAVPYAVAALFSLVLGHLSDAVTRRRGGSASSTRRLFVTVALLLSASIVLVPYVGETWEVIALLTLAVTGVSSVVGLNVALTNDLLTTPESGGLAVAFLILGGNLAGVVAPVVTGYAIVGSMGFDGAFWIAGVVLFLGSFSAWRWTRRPIELGAALVSSPRGVPATRS